MNDPHPFTKALADAADRLPGLPEHERARFKWLAWIRWSSRSGANFFNLMT